MRQKITKPTIATTAHIIYETVVYSSQIIINVMYRHAIETKQNGLEIDSS